MIKTAAQMANDDGKVSSPLDHVERRLGRAMKGLAKIVSDKPGVSLAVAFVGGIALAKLLRKIG